MTENEILMALQNYSIYMNEIEEQRKWFDKYPLIQTGKVPREDFSTKWMPRLSIKAKEYGLEIKLVNMISSLDSVNENIVKLFEAYEYIRNNNPIIDAHTGSTYRRINSLCSYIITDIRRFIDDMISVCWLLSQQGDVENIDIDCIGSCISPKSQYTDFEKFKDFLNLVNDIANSYKHSTTNNMSVLHGRDEPCIFAIYAKNNKHISHPQLIGTSIRDLTAKFNEFYTYSFHLIEEKCGTLEK